MFLLLWAEPLFPPPALFPVWFFSVLVVRACSSVVSRVNPSLTGLSMCRGGLRWHLPVTAAPPPHTLFCLHHSFTMGDCPRQLGELCRDLWGWGPAGSPSGKMAALSSLIVHAHTHTDTCMLLEVLSSDVLLPCQSGWAQGSPGEGVAHRAWRG